MVPKKRRQRAGALNYLKRKDVVRGVRSDGGAGVEGIVATSGASTTAATTLHLRRML